MSKRLDEVKMKSKFKKEKMEHNTLLDLLKSHFSKDEDEILDEEEEELARGRNYKHDRKKDRVSESGDYFNPKSEYEDGEEEEEPDEDEDLYDEDLESQEDEMEESARMPKARRKNLAIVLLTKKLGKGS